MLVDEAEGAVTSTPPRPVVFVVGMLDSPHLGRWLTTLAPLDAEFVLFPSGPNRTIHPSISELIRGAKRADFNVGGVEARFGLFMWAVDLVFRGWFRTSLLKRRLRQHRIDLIHAVELQHAGYLVARALRGRKTGRPKVALTNYGSDLYWYQRFPSHRRRLQELLALGDFYSAECARDIELAQELGFSGRTLTVLPNAGGISLVDEVSADDHVSAADRSIVLIKGYTNFVGRAQDLLREVSLRSHEFHGWDIVVYSSTTHARLRCWWMNRKHSGLRIRAIPKKRLSHAEMLDLFSRSAAYVGFSQSDGISTSFLEALSTGAYPLQTTTACIDEWREKGAEFSSLNVEAASDAIDELLTVLNDSERRQRAALRNLEVAKQHLHPNEIADTFRDDYRSVLGL